MSTFSKRLVELGHKSYAEYLDSPHWKAFKTAYRDSKQPMRCVICNARRIQLHHHTYLRLGAELPTDVTPLCRKHHAAVHGWLRASGLLFVEFTGEAIAALGGNYKPVVTRKKPARKSRKKKARERVERLAAELSKDPILFLYHKIIRSLDKSLSITEEQRNAALTSRDYPMIESIIRKGYRNRDNYAKRQAAPARPTKKKRKRDTSFEIHRRATEPFQLNDKPSVCDTGNWSNFLKKRRRES